MATSTEMSSNLLSLAMTNDSLILIFLFPLLSFVGENFLNKKKFIYFNYFVICQIKFSPSLMKFCIHQNKFLPNLNFFFTSAKLNSCQFHQISFPPKFLPLRYSINLHTGIAILICSASSLKVSLVSVLHFLNGEQFLSATFVSLSVPTTAVFPVTKIYASNNHKHVILMSLLKTLLNICVNSYLLIQCQ